MNLVHIMASGLGGGGGIKPTYTFSKFAISATNSADNVLSVTTEDFNFSGKPFSISCWWFAEEVTAAKLYSIFYRGGGTATTEALSIVVLMNNASSATIIVRMYATGHVLGIYTAPALPFVKGWNHLCVTFDGIGPASGLKIYSNAKLINNTPLTTDTLTTINNTVYPNKIGIHQNGTTTIAFNLADYIVFNRVVSSDEVLELYLHPYHNGITSLTTYADVISYYTFNNTLNDSKGNNHFTATATTFIETVNTAYVATTGNDATALLNDKTAKYITLNGVLTALMLAKSRFSNIMLDLGEFAAHTYTKTMPNLSIQGVKMPEFDNPTNPTKLINGSIIKGSSRFYGVKGITTKNVGFDAGLEWCTNVNSGTALDALAIDGANAPNEMSRNHYVENVITLCKSPASLVHSARFERINGLTIKNLTTAFGVHGIVLKCGNVTGLNLKAFGNNGDGLIIKKDVSGQLVGNIAIDGLYYRNINSSNPAAAIVISSGIAEQFITDVFITNCDMIENDLLYISGIGGISNIVIKDTNGQDILP